MAVDLHASIGPRAAPATPEASVHGAASPGQGTRPRVASQDILRGNAEVEIDHRGTLYRLRVTSLGKLILTK
jgi:hemin uptake protein HemP